MSIFLTIPEEQKILCGEYFFVIKDRFPVSEGHCLIISKALKSDYFELSEEEKQELTRLIVATKDYIEQEYTPNGYNIGMNCGEAAGQTVMHFHCHLIPRYKGDMEDARGGIRHCVAGKGYY
jgi:diadenosine tetraphosphate (Ap4A) HIT family hydrolase